jgi:hypothetical protein
MFDENHKHWLVIASFLLLIFNIISCSQNINLTENIHKKLSRENINSKLEYQKVDLSLEAKCPETLTLNIINAETRQDNYIVFDRGPIVWHIIPIEFIDDIVKYTTERLVDSNFKLDKDLGKKIYISLDEVKVEGAGFVAQGFVKLRIEIPEINFKRAYSGSDGSGVGDLAVAYAAHHAVAAFINDPDFQRYVKCQ